MKKYLLQLAVLLMLVSTSSGYYQAEQGRWISIDPVQENGGENIYAFVVNSPYRYTDDLGLSRRFADPGIRAAIQDALNTYNVPSTRDNIEYCGLICKKCQDGEESYYSTQTTGDANTCDPGSVPCEEGDTQVEIWHTHGNFVDADGDGQDDRDGTVPQIIGGDDRRYAMAANEGEGMPINLGTPEGNWLRYDPNVDYGWGPYGSDCGSCSVYTPPAE